MSLLDELGLEDDFEWKQLGLCRNIPLTVDVFFEGYEDVEVARATDEMCIHCPVIKQCFFAGSDGQYGVWGGVYWNGVGKPDQVKNSHKTDEFWAELKNKVE